MEELLKTFEKDPTLGHEVEVMWARGASAQEVAAMLTGKGVDADATQVEELLALLQERRVKKATGENGKVDLEQLKQIAGGGTGVGCYAFSDCDKNFNNSKYYGVKHCYTANFCDEILCVNP